MKAEKRFQLRFHDGHDSDPLSVQEVLRVYPPVGIGQIREAKNDVSLAGKLKLPRGVLVWVSHFAMHNAQHNWDNPEDFNPGKHKPGHLYYALPVMSGNDSAAAGHICMKPILHSLAIQRPGTILFPRLCQNPGTETMRID